MNYFLNITIKHQKRVSKTLKQSKRNINVENINNHHVETSNGLMFWDDSAMFSQLRFQKSHFDVFLWNFWCFSVDVLEKLRLKHQKWCFGATRHVTDAPVGGGRSTSTTYYVSWYPIEIFQKLDSNFNLIVIGYKLSLIC